MCPEAGHHVDVIRRRFTETKKGQKDGKKEVVGGGWENRKLHQSNNSGTYRVYKPGSSLSKWPDLIYLSDHIRHVDLRIPLIHQES